MTRINDLARRVQTLEDGSDGETEEYAPMELTEKDYEFLDAMFGGGEWSSELTESEGFTEGERPPELTKAEKEMLAEHFDVDPWESR